MINAFKPSPYYLSIDKIISAAKFGLQYKTSPDSGYSHSLLEGKIRNLSTSKSPLARSYFMVRRKTAIEKQPSLTAIKSNKSLSSLKSITSGSMMKIQPIRALQDNYMYLLIDDATRHAAAIDPVNSSAMASAVSDYRVDLKAILTTHHHHDHAHGNAEMLSMFPDICVYGGDTRIQALTRQVEHGDVIKLGSLNIECLSTPCHTKGHICYYVTSEADRLASENGSADDLDERVVFTGDTLFIAGCGRFFEGTAEQMNRNLNHTLANLPNSTKVYCGHEYTVTNLKFALTVEPQNVDIKAKLNWAQTKVTKKEPTVPSTIGEEKKINPFMRLKHAHVKSYAGETDENEVMTVLRHRKNDFKP